MSALGLNGIMHLDVISFVPPYPCKDPMHPLNRKQTVEYQNKVGEYARKIFGGLASEGGYDHVAHTLDFALYLWTYPLWDDNPEMLPEKYVPLWQLVYHGIIMSNPYYCTIDALYENLMQPPTISGLTTIRRHGNALAKNRGIRRPSHVLLQRLQRPQPDETRLRRVPKIETPSTFVYGRTF